MILSNKLATQAHKYLGSFTCHLHAREGGTSNA